MVGQASGSNEVSDAVYAVLEIKHRRFKEREEATQKGKKSHSIMIHSFYSVLRGRVWAMKSRVVCNPLTNYIVYYFCFLFFLLTFITNQKSTRLFLYKMKLYFDYVICSTCSSLSYWRFVVVRQNQPARFLRTVDALISSSWVYETLKMTHRPCNWPILPLGLIGRFSCNVHDWECLSVSNFPDSIFKACTFFVFYMIKIVYQIIFLLPYIIRKTYHFYYVF